jgi:hypothetical protein
MTQEKKIVLTEEEMEILTQEVEEQNLTANGTIVLPASFFISNEKHDIELKSEYNETYCKKKECNLPPTDMVLLLGETNYHGFCEKCTDEIWNRGKAHASYKKSK